MRIFRCFAVAASLRQAHAHVHDDDHYGDHDHDPVNDTNWTTMEPEPDCSVVMFSDLLGLVSENSETIWDPLASHFALSAYQQSNLLNIVELAYIQASNFNRCLGEVLVPLLNYLSGLDGQSFVNLLCSVFNQQWIGIDWMLSEFTDEPPLNDTDRSSLEEELLAFASEAHEVASAFLGVLNVKITEEHLSNINKVAKDLIPAILDQLEELQRRVVRMVDSRPSTDRMMELFKSNVSNVYGYTCAEPDIDRLVVKAEQSGMDLSYLNTTELIDFVLSVVLDSGGDPVIIFVALMDFLGISGGGDPGNDSVLDVMSKDEWRKFSGAIAELNRTMLDPDMFEKNWAHFKGVVNSTIDQPIGKDGVAQVNNWTGEARGYIEEFDPDNVDTQEVATLICESPSFLKLNLRAEDPIFEFLGMEGNHKQLDWFNTALVAIEDAIDANQDLVVPVANVIAIDTLGSDCNSNEGEGGEAGEGGEGDEGGEDDDGEGITDSGTPALGTAAWLGLMSTVASLCQL